MEVDRSECAVSRVLKSTNVTAAHRLHSSTTFGRRHCVAGQVQELFRAVATLPFQQELWMWGLELETCVLPTVMDIESCYHGLGADMRG